MLIKTLPVGMLATNCYIVTDGDSLKCAIVDPGAESNTILDYIESNCLLPEAIFLTHGHFDHHMALPQVLDAYDIPVYLSKNDVDRDGQEHRHKVPHDKNMSYCCDGDVINIGSLTFTVIETPGHSPGSITLKCRCDAAAGLLPGDSACALFTGDTLFCGDCGRTDLEGGNRETILKSLCRLAALEGDYEVYPGHDESTTLDNERCHNMDMKIATGVLK